ncbi:MAG TPA: sigma-70 family RNA polymerase sigma factor [Solirubrobacteraceae bacterium]|nr:sigma-70 family RNA polymerase sigma factor [Solirubrobacteraceae bacterium]
MARTGYARQHSRASQDAEDRELIRRYRTDPALRPQIVASFMSLAESLAKRSHRGEEPLEDLVQVAAVGLLKALRGFDPERGGSFAAFAVPTITGELRRHFRDRGWAVRVPRDLQERALLVRRADERLAGALGRPATADELATELSLTVEDVVEARLAAGAMRAGSLDRPAGDADGETTPLVALRGDLDAGFERVEMGATLARLSEALPERQRRILALRYVAGMTQEEIGRQVGLSQMHVSRLLRQALERMQALAAAA